MVTREIDETIPADRAILRHIVRDLDQNVGVYATVRTPGVVRVGDPSSSSRPTAVVPRGGRPASRSARAYDRDHDGQLDDLLQSARTGLRRGPVLAFRRDARARPGAPDARQPVAAVRVRRRVPAAARSVAQRQQREHRDPRRGPHVEVRRSWQERTSNVRRACSTSTRPTTPGCGGWSARRSRRRRSRRCVRGCRCSSTRCSTTIADRGEGDVVAELAFPLPFDVISEMLGMPAIGQGADRRVVGCGGQDARSDHHRRGDRGGGRR